MPSPASTSRRRRASGCGLVLALIALGPLVLPGSLVGQEIMGSVRVLGGHTNVHMGASTSQQVLWLAPQGTVLPVIGRRGEWLQVRLSPEFRQTGIVMRWYRNEDQGFVHESTVEVVEGQIEPQPQRAQRTGPSAGSAVPGIPGPGSPPPRMGGYEVVLDWPRGLPDATPGEHDGWTWASASGVWAESPDKVWVGQRGEIELPPGAPAWICGCLLDPRRTNTGRRPYAGETRDYDMRRHHIIFTVDRDGNTIDEWLQHDDYLAPSEGLARGPHKLLINPYDPERHIWIVDDDLHEINKFTNDGRLVMTMGERGVPGRGPNNFNRPTDITWLPDGTFFVADGYAGTRVAKFDPDGNFIRDWGQPPVDPNNPRPYEFWSVHSIGLSRDRRLFVADREHSRMQVFDEDGNFLEMWPTGHDSAVLAHFVTEDDHVWVADWTTNRLVKYDLDGRYMLDIGGPGAMPGQFDGVHQIHVDQDGNLYLSEIGNARSQKFRPLPDADPATLVGPQVGGWP